MLAWAFLIRLARTVESECATLFTDFHLSARLRPAMHPWPLYLSIALTCVLVIAYPQGRAHAETASQSLPDTWYHSDTHPAHALFRRQGYGLFPEVGSAGSLATL